MHKMTKKDDNTTLYWLFFEICSVRHFSKILTVWWQNPRSHTHQFEPCNWPTRGNFWSDVLNDSIVLRRSDCNCIILIKSSNMILFSQNSSYSYSLRKKFQLYPSFHLFGSNIGISIAYNNKFKIIHYRFIHIWYKGTMKQRNGLCKLKTNSVGQYKICQ